MSFPLAIGAHTLGSPPELAELVARDAQQGGLVVADQRPAQWLLALHARGELSQEHLLGLAAGMIRQPQPAMIGEGARLAEALHPSPLGPLVVAAAAHHDPVVLLQVDPGAPGRSVEDTLLRISVTVGDHTDATQRSALLRLLRHAGLPELEGRVLIAYGEVVELRRWWPALRSEGLADSLQALVEQRIARGDDGGRWLAARYRG